MTDKMIKTKFPYAHNVFKMVTEVEAQFERNLPKNLAVAPFIQKLIDKLLARNPRWEFITKGFGSSTEEDTYVHSHFTIVCDGEELGWIGTDRNWRTSEVRYEFDCDRMKLKRQKSASPRTKDLNKAVKAITASMYNRTPAERLTSARNIAASTVNRISSNASYEYKNAQDRVLPHMTEFVAQRWEEFCAVQMEPLEAKARDTLLDKKQARENALTISEPIDTDKGYLLIQAGDVYIVGHYNLTEVPAMVRLDEMPDRLKGSLGLLRLLEPKKYAPGIGVRVDETTFYVVDADEQQQP